jgi:hypothetical protein
LVSPPSGFGILPKVRDIPSKLRTIFGNGPVKLPPSHRLDARTMTCSRHPFFSCRRDTVAGSVQTTSGKASGDDTETVLVFQEVPLAKIAW